MLLQEAMDKDRTITLPANRRKIAGTNCGTETTQEVKSIPVAAMIRGT
jgi:hypothetical protein